MKPRPLDQAIASLTTFAAEAKQPIEWLEAAHVQAWIDEKIKTVKAVTVARKIGEVSNYWRYLQSRQIVPIDRDPFARRRIKDPPNRRETRDEQRQKWNLSEVRDLLDATVMTDPPLRAAIMIAAYSCARIEGAAQLRVGDIRHDQRSDTYYVRMAGKTARGDRDVPIHPKLKVFIDRLVF